MPDLRLDGMCRLLGLVSATPVTATDALGRDFGDFVNLSAGKHRDGWGVVGDLAGERRIVRSTGAAHSSAAFGRATETAMTAGLIHLRAATAGLAVTEANTHPFTAGEIAFAHNGQIDDIPAVEGLVDDDLRERLIGETDSERYFHAILSQARKAPLLEAVRTVVTRIEATSRTPSLNAMVLTPDSLIVVSSFDSRLTGDQDEDYFELRYRETADSVVVASSGWPQPGWQTVPERSILRVDRSTRLTTLVDIDSGEPRSLGEERIAA